MPDNTPQDQPDELIGTTLGQYEILEEVGRGGMATVYRALQTSMNRTVAIKVLPKSFMHDKSFYERFTREVDVISHLEHPHIVPIYDYGEKDGAPYIIMRYLSGGSLARYIRQGGASDLNALVRPLSQIAQALDHAHARNIVHRDLKPGNILLDDQQNAYLSDFGIARVIGSDMTGSAIIGTPSYMSPEQANGEVLDGRSDVYALGIVLFELIAGREPFRADTPIALILKHVNEPLPALGFFREEVPAVIEEVLQKSTAKNRNERYNSAGEMAQAFADAVREGFPGSGTPTERFSPTERDLSVPAPKPSRPERGMEGPTITPPAGGEGGLRRSDLPVTPPYTQPDKQTSAVEWTTPSDPSRFWLYATVAVILVGVGVVVALLLSANPEPAPPPSIPTPFAGGAVISEAPYSLSMVNAWIPPQRYEELPTSTDLGEVLAHRWAAEDGAASVTLTLVEPGEDVMRTAASYDETTTTAAYTALDESVAPDGTLRRSYRIDREETGQSGQVDRFYMERGGYLLVLEMYTADETGNEWVPTLQNILDSVRAS